MKKLFLLGVLGLGLSFSAAAVFAGPVADSVKAAMGEARENLVAMLGTTDKAAQAKHEEAVKASTAKVDEIIAKHAGAFKEFAAIWTEFKATRDGQIIPNVKAGKLDEAKTISSTVQAERIKKMAGILGTMAQ
ncbi:MAG: hypothetical protein HQL64_03605 [Magnetococcales bacterium]|nr:hypothetical protein [Magnetococcales bacterium]